MPKRIYSYIQINMGLNILCVEENCYEFFGRLVLLYFI